MNVCFPRNMQCCTSLQTAVFQSEHSDKCAHTQKQFRLYRAYIISWTFPVWLSRSPPVLLYSYPVSLFLPYASPVFHTRLKLTLSTTQIQYLSLPAFRFQQKGSQLWIYVHLNLLFTKYCLKSSYWKPTFSNIYLTLSKTTSSLLSIYTIEMLHSNEK